MSKKQQQDFIDALQQAIDWRKANQNDPYGVDNAVIVALEEVKTALAAVDAEDEP